MTSLFMILNLKLIMEITTSKCQFPVVRSWGPIMRLMNNGWTHLAERP